MWPSRKRRADVDPALPLCERLLKGEEVSEEELLSLQSYAALRDITNIQELCESLVKDSIATSERELKRRRGATYQEDLLARLEESQLQEEIAGVLGRIGILPIELQADIWSRYVNPAGDLTRQQLVTRLIDERVLVPEEYRAGYLAGVRDALRAAPDLPDAAPELLYRPPVRGQDEAQNRRFAEHLRTRGGCVTRRGAVRDTAQCLPDGIGVGTILFRVAVADRNDDGYVEQLPTQTEREESGSYPGGIEPDQVVWLCRCVDVLFSFFGYKDLRSFTSPTGRFTSSQMVHSIVGFLRSAITEEELSLLYGTPPHLLNESQRRDVGKQRFANLSVRKSAEITIIGIVEMEPRSGRHYVRLEALPGRFLGQVSDIATYLFRVNLLSSATLWHQL